MLVGITEASRQLGVSAEHIRRQVRSGRWPVYKLGLKAVRLDVEEIRQLGRLATEREKEVKGA